MTTAAGYFDRKPTSSIRPGLSHLQREPGSSPAPQTPQQRTFSSVYSSPAASYRSEEEVIVFEFGARTFRAGFAGESAPRCTVGFGPEESRRVGDYRRWLPGYEDCLRKRKRGYKWGEDFELWRMDLQDLDLGLVEDKIERAVREAYSRYLLLDSKSKRLLLVVPSVLPHQLLSSVLSILFLNFQNPNITLLSNPILSTVASGCRSSLVVDVGWSETVVTAIYEYREVYHCSSIRAMKMVTQDVARLLCRYCPGADAASSKQADAEVGAQPPLDMRFEHAEEVTTRMAWCRRKNDSTGTSSQKDVSKQLDHLSIAATEIQQDPIMSIPSPLHPRKTLQIPFTQFAVTVETALLPNAQDFRNLDNHESPLHTLIYKSLLSLPPDVRAICMSCIIITGGGSNIPGLKGRLLEEVAALVQERGWDPVYRKAAEERRRRLKEISTNRQDMPIEMDKSKTQNGPTVDGTQNTTTLKSTSLEPQVPDPIADRLRQDHAKESVSAVSGIIRGVDTLGAWAGGSLVAGLKIKGIVEVERDSFLLHGLAGAKRDPELNSVVHRQSLGPGIPMAAVGEKGGWTLGGWA